MTDKQISDSETILQDIVESPYKYGFRTKIETEEFPKGLNSSIINQISDKKMNLIFSDNFEKNLLLFGRSLNNLIGDI